MLRAMAAVQEESTASAVLLKDSTQILHSFLSLGTFHGNFGQWPCVVCTQLWVCEEVYKSGGGGMIKFPVRYYHHQSFRTNLYRYFFYFFIHLIHLSLHIVSMDCKLVLEEGDRVKWLTPGFKIGCGVVISMSVTGDGTIIYGIQVDGGRVAHLPHSCVMRD